mmetsp:Transcript_83827/g.153023  ORF Transcript_83827/g.153023 Transcript_83827/m.153023 type:complete len:91 (-) Transcript_83827:89-361(-)
MLSSISLTGHFKIHCRVVKHIVLLMAVLLPATSLLGCSSCEIREGSKVCTVDVSGECCEGLKQTEGLGALDCINDDDLWAIMRADCVQAV